MRFLLAIVVIIMFFSGCLQDSETGIEYVTRKYGIAPERVIELANLLEIAPDEIDPPPASAFPVSYFKKQFVELEETKGRVLTNAEVKELIKGYMAKCETSSISTIYFFYSTNVRVGWSISEISVAMEVNQSPYDDIHEFDLSDASVNPRDNPFFENCIAQYLVNRNNGTPTAQP